MEMAVSPTGEGVAFADAEGLVSVWRAREDSKFCRFEGEVELPDTVEPVERISWSDTTSLNSIGMPHYSTPLLSLLPPTFDFTPSPTHHSKTPIDPSILASVKTVDFVGYAPYPPALKAAGRRNQVASDGGEKGGKRRVDVPLFRSEKERKEKKKMARVVSVDRTAEEEMDSTLTPSHYRKVEIKYSRFGVEDFDFGFYNKTPYSGLETHITNSYTNSLLQALHYTLPERRFWIFAPGKWYLFNDFLVKPISEEEALSYPSTWKLIFHTTCQIPAVMFYQRVDADELLDFSSLPLSSEPGILCQDITISRNRDPTLIKHQPFTLQELPRRGTLVSIDAEFVSLQQEEAEFHSDGTKKVIRPSRMTLARVSVLRGEGPDTGIPFIDDHIHTSDTVVDYLTEFSGIRAGDLDPNVSRHTLVPLKVAYKKLRLLVDLGCVFIGHGLNKDFRIINIYIPPEQIIDTVNIYHQAHRQRKLSLRFLAWAVLHSAIQADTHDSIEDARTALQLYEEHNRLEAQGAWEDCLEEVYHEGRQTNFMVPVVKPPPVANPPPTPMQQGLGALGPLHRPPPITSRTGGKAVSDECERSNSGIILFIDEIHTVMAGNGGSSVDAANLLKPTLARGKLRSLRATTLAEYRKHIEKDAAFERRFQQVMVNEPTVPETISILRGIKDEYEVLHGVQILDSALVSAATLAHRYLTSLQLPDSTINSLEIDLQALKTEWSRNKKDEVAKGKIKEFQEGISTLDEELAPIKARYEGEKAKNGEYPFVFGLRSASEDCYLLFFRGRIEELQDIRKKIHTLKAKADDAERHYDLAAKEKSGRRRDGCWRRKDSFRRRRHPEAIQTIVSNWSGIPVSSLKTTERQKLLRMEKILSKSVVGQPEAIKAVADAIGLSRSGLGNQDRLIASVLFIGPSGTGKTLLTKTLASFLFDSPDVMIRIEGSEHSEKHAISRLIGTPPGYIGSKEGGQLTE
ncbi:PAB-dependent poly(A)-specific ribonuclease subunit 2, partial [Phenoliferia sp. Uapishka_3]